MNEHAIYQLLQNTAQLTDKLLVLVRQEKNFLEQAKSAELDKNTEEKVQIILQLEHNQQLLPAGKLTAIRQHPKLGKLMTKIADDLLAVKQLSAVNEKIINISTTQLDRVLDVICGKSQNTYSKHAKTDEPIGYSGSIAKI